MTQLDSGDQGTSALGLAAVGVGFIVLISLAELLEITLGIPRNITMGAQAALATTLLLVYHTRGTHNSPKE